MPVQRLKGQEVQIIIVRDGEIESELTSIKNFNAEIMLEQLSEGFLGEKTERHDEIYKGTKGDFEMQVHSSDFLKLANAVKDRAQRNTPDMVVNISAVMNFPNGETPTVLFPDAKFGPMPINVNDRASYATFKVDFIVDDYEVQFS